MPTFIDESGDFGPGPDSSDLFMFGAVWCERIEEAAECCGAIAAVRRKRQLKVRHEFRHATISSVNRRAFYAGVACQPFRFVVSVVDKRTAERRGALTKDMILANAIGAVAATLHEYYQIAEGCKATPLKERVLVDHHTDGEYVGRIECEFRALPSAQSKWAPLVKSVKTARSESDDMIQLADMVCGAVRLYYAGDRDAYQLLRPKAIRLIEWP